MKNTTDLKTKVQNLSLPIEIAQLILKDKYFAEYLVEEKEKYPFPANYTPEIIEIRFNNILYLKSINNKLIYNKLCPTNMETKFIEWRFDDECAIFQTSDKLIIDRTTNLVDFDKQIYLDE